MSGPDRSRNFLAKAEKGVLFIYDRVERLFLAVKRFLRRRINGVVDRVFYSLYPTTQIVVTQIGQSCDGGKTWVAVRESLSHRGEYKQAGPLHELYPEFNRWYFMIQGITDEIRERGIVSATKLSSIALEAKEVLDSKTGIITRTIRITRVVPRKPPKSPVFPKKK